MAVARAKAGGPEGIVGYPPHLRRDWAHAFHICAGTGLTPIALKLVDAKVLMKIFSPHLPKLLECHSMLLDELRTKFKAGEGVKAVSETLDFYAPFFKITVCARRPPPDSLYVARRPLHAVYCMSSVACRVLHVVCCMSVACCLLHVVGCMSSTLPPSRRRPLRCAARALLRWELRDSSLSRSRVPAAPLWAADGPSRAEPGRWQATAAAAAWDAGGG